MRCPICHGTGLSAGGWRFPGTSVSSIFPAQFRLRVPLGASRCRPRGTVFVRCLARPANLASQTVTGPWQGRSNTRAAIGRRARADGCQIVQGSAILIFTPMRTGVVPVRHLPQQMSGQPLSPFRRGFRAHAAFTDDTRPVVRAHWHPVGDGVGACLFPVLTLSGRGQPQSDPSARYRAAI